MIRKKILTTSGATHLCWIIMFASCLYGFFSRYAGFLPYPKDMCIQGYLGSLNCPIWNSSGVWVYPVMTDMLSSVGSYSAPWAIQDKIGLPKNKQVGKWMSELLQSIIQHSTHIGSLFRSLVMFLWPRKCCLIPIYIN